jgi:hypothetical protein
MKATNALMMMSNGGGLRITEKCKIPGYKYQVWYSKKAITNILCLKNLIKCYRVTFNSKLDTTFVVNCGAFGLPDLLFKMHSCSLHVCYPKKMGQFGLVQTVHDNMKLFSKRQIIGANKARSIVCTGGVPGTDVTINDVKATYVIWGQSVLKMKGNTVQRNSKLMTQSIIKVLRQDVKLAIDCFLVDKHVFFTTLSTKICFTTIPHSTSRNKNLIWVAFLKRTYMMYFLRGFHIV